MPAAFSPLEVYFIRWWGAYQYTVQCTHNALALRIIAMNEAAGTLARFQRTKVEDYMERCHELPAPMDALGLHFAGDFERCWREEARLLAMAAVLAKGRPS